MTEILTSTFLVLGTLFIVLSSLGLRRFPDVYGRLHAATKASTLGIAGIVAASAIHFGAAGHSVLAEILVIIFMLLTNPVGGHMIGRAAYLTGIPMTEDTILDEMKRAGEHADGDHDQY